MKDMFYTIDKLRNRTHELDNYRYRDVIELEYFNTKLYEIIVNSLKYKKAMVNNKEVDGEVRDNYIIFKYII